MGSKDLNSESLLPRPDSVGNGCHGGTTGPCLAVLLTHEASAVLRVWPSDVIRGVSILLRTSAEFLSFRIGSLRDWVGDSQQLFLSFFCLCPLVWFRGTKGKPSMGVECQRMAVNGSEPHDAGWIGNGQFRGVSHGRPHLLVSLQEYGDWGAPPATVEGRSGRSRLAQTLGAPEHHKFLRAHVSPPLNQIWPSGALCWLLETCNCLGEGNFSFPLALMSFSERGRCFSELQHCP